MPATTSLVVTGGAVVDGSGSTPLPDAVVVVAGGRVVAAGPAERVAVAAPPDAHVVDASGGTVLPGFVDAHVHIEGAVDEKLAGFLAEGVTTVGNTGGSLAAMPELRELGARPDRARVVNAGMAITAPGGYPSNRGDGSAALFAGTADEARRGVDLLVEHGIGMVKLALEPFDFNFQDPGTMPVLTPEAAAAATARAHDHELVVRAHVHHLDQLDVALAAGVDTVEHVLFAYHHGRGYVDLWRTGELSIGGLPDLPAAARRMVEAGVTLVPTIGQELRNIRRGLPDLPEAALEAMAAVMVDVVATFRAAGGTVAVGDDWVGLPGQRPGLPWEELVYLRRAGLDTGEIVVALTREAARVCGQGERLGVLEAGRVADLVVVDGDPLTHLEALRSVRAVVKDGRLLGGASGAAA